MSHESIFDEGSRNEKFVYKIFSRNLEQTLIEYLGGNKQFDNNLFNARRTNLVLFNN